MAVARAPLCAAAVLLACAAAARQVGSPPRRSPLSSVETVDAEAAQIELNVNYYETGRHNDDAIHSSVNGVGDDATAEAEWTLSVIHLNDFHARFEPVSPRFTSCDPRMINTCVPYPCRGEGCVGGIARVATAMAQLRRDYPNSVALNAGDNFQGSIYYLVHRHAIMSFFLNSLGFDAMALGNHEFDQGVENVKRFVQSLTFPTLSANMYANAEPELAAMVKSTVVVERDGRRVGIIGYTLNYTHDVSDTGGVRWGSELYAVDREASLLKAAGVHVIVCVSHSGLAQDLHVARHSDHVDLIVGGHSHSLLYTGAPPSDDYVADAYPAVVHPTSSSEYTVRAVRQTRTPRSPRTVLVVQAMSGTKYLGHLLVHFDKAGEVVGWQGRPLLLDQSVPQDKHTLSLLRSWQPLVRSRGQRLVGSLQERLSQDEMRCLRGECNIGNVVADAFVDYWRKQDAAQSPTIAAVMGWSMVANLEKGDVRFVDVFNVLPYEYTVDAVRISGRGLVEAIEVSVEDHGALFQWSGVRVELDLRQPAGRRVRCLRVRTRLDQRPEDYEVARPDAEYRLAAQSVALQGGYANNGLRQAHFNRTRGPMDYEVLAAFLGQHSNLARAALEGRVTVLGGINRPRQFMGLTKAVRN